MPMAKRCASGGAINGDTAARANLPANRRDDGRNVSPRERQNRNEISSRNFSLQAGTCHFSARSPALASYSAIIFARRLGGRRKRAWWRREALRADEIMPATRHLIPGKAMSCVAGRRGVVMAIRLRPAKARNLWRRESWCLCGGEPFSW